MSAPLDLLIKNLFVFGGAAVLSRAINVVGLPVLAWIVADAGVLGRFDLLIVVGSLGASLANLGMNEAAHKIYFDYSSTTEKRAVMSTLLGLGGGLTIFFSILIGVSVWVAQWHELFTGTSYAFPIWAALFVLAFRFRFLIQTALVLENKRITITGVALGEIAFFYIFAIGLIWIAESEDAVLQSVRLVSVVLASLVLFQRGFYKWYRGTINYEVGRRLLKLGFPLCLSSVFYWALAFSDRVIVGGFLGATALGTYAVCAKFSAIAELFRVAINQGMAYFIYSTASEAGHDRRMYLISSTVVVLAVFLFGLSSWLASTAVAFLLPAQYSQASIIIPYLITGPLLLTAFQIVGAELVLSEKTVWITVTQVSGVLVAIIISLMTVNILGIKGPAIGGFLGYLTMLVSVLATVRVIGRQKYAVRLIYWLLPLVLCFLSTISNNEIVNVAGIAIALAMPVCWIVVHRRECMRLVAAMTRLILRT